MAAALPDPVSSKDGGKRPRTRRRTMVLLMLATGEPRALSAIHPLNERTPTMRMFSLGGALLLTVASAAAAQQQAGTSAAAVKELSALLTSHNQAAIAARDPDSGAFVAALLYPGVQLLVVSAKPASTASLEAQLAAKNFQDVYAALQDGTARAGRLFVQDLGADGLNDGGNSVDVVYEEGRQTLFDGNPRSHKLSEKAYREAFTSADTRYAHMLSVLLAEARRASGQL
jgi:hypothetical protein